MTLSTISHALLVCMAAPLFCSCGEVGDNDEPASMSIDSTEQKSPLPAPPPTAVNAIDVCALATTLPQSLETVRQSASMIPAAPDSCFLRLVDSLGALARRGASPEIIVAVDSLYGASDGYASEAVASILPDIFRHSPEATVAYLVDTRHRHNESLRNALVESLRQDRATAPDTTEALKRDRQLFELALQSLSPGERAFVDSLMREALGGIDN